MKQIKQIILREREFVSVSFLDGKYDLGGGGFIVFKRVCCYIS